MKFKKIIFLLFAGTLFISLCSGQTPDSIYQSNIKSVTFYNYGDNLSMPVVNLNSGDQTELHFDDMDGDVKYYYYTFQICNQDWTPANMSEFDFIKGFTQMRINTYRRSNVTYSKYTHYQAMLPDRSCMPSRSGNYIVKVFLDGDTSKLAFTRRLLVLDNKSIIKAQVNQPFTPQYFRTHQKVQFSINISGLNSFTPNQEIKVVILQNHRWDNALMNISPTFIRGNLLEYNTEENTVFPAGKEWRWLDVRDFHLQSDRVLRADYFKNSTEVYLKPDLDRTSLRYVYYADLNGNFYIDNTMGLNPLWQADYATVHFVFTPPDNNPFPDRDVYLAGKLTDYALTDSLKMKFNAETGNYETKLFLKQGYYNYTYQAVNKNNPADRINFEGNYYETENEYTILVYYRSFTGRSDELIGVGKINSRSDRPGFGF
jgi:hypothetical protein